MQKTILGLDKRLSIALLSIISMLFTFMNSSNNINSFISFIFIVVKSLVFVCVPLIVYFLEKKEDEFKRISGIYSSYFMIGLLMVVICSVLSSGGLLSEIGGLLLDLVNLVILLSSLFIFVEQILDYCEIKNKVYTNTIMKIVYTMANFVSYPFFKIFKKRDIDNYDL